MRCDCKIFIKSFLPYLITVVLMINIAVVQVVKYVAGPSNQDKHT